MSLLGKVFVVTGGASGIGLATVRKLLQSSATVHSIDKSDRVLTEDSQGGTLWSYPSVDVSSRASVTQTFKQIGKRNPKLDGLVNCAGIVKQHPSSVDSDDAFKQVWNVNLSGTWNATTDFIRIVEAGKAASSKEAADVSIVNVGSMASFRGIPGIPGYVASKHAVLGLTRAWAQEWGPLGVRVNLVGPGMVKTPMTEGDGNRDVEEVSTFPTVLKPFAEPEEIADIILFLLGDSSSYITGQAIQANGGWL
ncbi:hypothetical protein NKR23_g4643 [Pleurostoma richardsiae]|uniref:Ketoreductase domain-containing protein n=1 Tax=Pleurostoma richardsiae TaxID=41990 RepID=A0AA38VFQ3_9PEZI|nr:hypothetical protein NKR23_g4643 [Pleurostoma richardsiae]